MKNRPELYATIITLFPQIFPGPLQYSLAGLALKKGIWAYDLVDIREFGVTKHKNVDDIPYGGGNGMIMRADVLGNAIDNAKLRNPAGKIVYMSPKGIPLKQKIVHQIAASKNVIILCGRFEGIDERVIEEYQIQEISIGDFILSGGELASLVLLDACIRILPGVLQNQDTLTEESFSCFGNSNHPLLEYPLYTKPAEWRGRRIPEILLSGHHQKIQEWREKQAIELTKKRRPDLLT